MKKLLLILCLFASPAWAQFADPDQRAYSGQMLRTTKPQQRITAQLPAWGVGQASNQVPAFSIWPAGVPGTGWPAAGTIIGANVPLTFTGNLIDLQVNAATKFNVNNVGAITLGNGAGSIGVNGTIAYTVSPIILRSPGGTTAGDNVRITGSSNFAQTAGGTQTDLDSTGTFAPASGAATYTGIMDSSTIAQTSTASGVSRGFYANPTLTTAADYRALEVAGYTSNLLGNPVAGTFYEALFNQPTITAASVSQTVATASTVDIKGAPVASTNVTITTPYALNVEAGNINSGGIISGYNGVATKGNGVPSIYGYGRATAQAAANSSVATYTVGGSDGSFLVSANVLITAGSMYSFTVTCAYTDESNTARVQTFSFAQLAGTLVQTIASAGSSTYEGVPLHIRAKSGTTITIATAAGGSYTTVTYNVEGLIQQVD